MTVPSKTLGEYYTCYTVEQVLEFWNLLETQCKSNIMKTKKTKSRGSSNHPLLYINTLRSWAMRVSLSDQQKEQLKSYCTQQTTPFQDYNKCMEISRDMSISIDQVRHYFRLLESEYLQSKIASRLIVKKRQAKKTTNFTKLIKKKTRTRRKIHFNTLDYILLIKMVVLLKHCFRQISWYCIAQFFEIEEDLIKSADVLRRQYNLISNKTKGKLVIHKIENVIHALSFPDYEDMREFPLQELAESIDLDESISNELEIAMAPPQKQNIQNAIQQDIYLSNFYPNSISLALNSTSKIEKLLGIDQVKGHNVFKARYLLRAFLLNRQSEIYQYCIQHNIKADVLDIAINLELQNKSIISNNSDAIKYRPSTEYLQIFENNINLKMMQFYSNFEFDLNRIDGDSSFYLIHQMINGYCSISSCLDSNIRLVPNMVRNTTEVKPILTMSMRSHDKVAIERTSVETILYQHLNNLHQRKLFFSAATNVFFKIKDNPLISASTLEDFYSIGLSKSELQRILMYLKEIEFVFSETIEVELETLFGIENNIEDYLCIYPDAYLKVPLELREHL
eukprot:NODE_530_length_6411_cov_0.882288.p1 type:complete len:564 gc:universal NODE_530_length_6411_cov_0.882288:1338-3029(+)